MTEPLFVPKVACPSCPYRRSTPSGVWAATQYEILRGLDSRAQIEIEVPQGKVSMNNPALGFFQCHQTNATGRDTICRGWLSVERDSMGSRLLQRDGRIEMDDVPTEDESDTYYATGTDACEAGLRDVDNPSSAARFMAHGLVDKGAGRWEEDDDDEH